MPRCLATWKLSATEFWLIVVVSRSQSTAVSWAKTLTLFREDRSVWKRLIRRYLVPLVRAYGKKVVQQLFHKSLIVFSCYREWNLKTDEEKLRRWRWMAWKLESTGTFHSLNKLFTFEFGQGQVPNEQHLLLKQLLHSQSLWTSTAISFFNMYNVRLFSLLWLQGQSVRGWKPPK